MSALAVTVKEMFCISFCFPCCTENILNLDPKTELNLMYRYSPNLHTYTHTHTHKQSLTTS